MDAKTQLAMKMFQSYNAQGPNPNKTWDGKDVPPWEKLGDQVQGKWLAAAECALKPNEPQVMPDGVQKPSIGRIVTFAEEGGPYPALIGAVNTDGTVELATFGRNSLYFQHGVRFDADGSKGTWRWPPRV